VKTRIISSAESEAIDAFLDLVALACARAHLRSQQAIAVKPAKAIDPAKMRRKKQTCVEVK
jgi:hypothetical protein